MAHLLESFYPFLPVPLQNLGISLYGLAWRSGRLGGKFAEYVDHFRERDSWSSERMREYTQAELRNVVGHAFAQVAYYQDKWKQLGIHREDLMGITKETLPCLPITSKQDLRSQPDAFLARDAAPRNRLHRYFSSGSTGTPITAICTTDDHRRFIAAREVRSFGWANTSIRNSRAMIGGRLVVPKGIGRAPFYRYNRAEKQAYFSAYHISPGNVANYVEGFNRHRPRLLTGYANAYFLLARMMIAQGITLDYEPTAAVLCSEKLTGEMKTVIQSAFHTRAYEEYGAVENCVLATECEQGNLHISSDFGIVEIVDETGQPVPPGKEGRILCTGLLNKTHPLIRYEIGDVGIWSDQKCSCGRNHLPVLQEIVGRLEDIIVGPDGRELVRFHGIFIDLANVLEGQVIQEERFRFTVKVVTASALTAEQCQLIRRRFTERLGHVEVNIERVASIPRTERGKFRAVISKIPYHRNTPTSLGQLHSSAV